MRLKYNYDYKANFNDWKKKIVYTLIYAAGFGKV